MNKIELVISDKEIDFFESIKSNFEESKLTYSSHNEYYPEFKFDIENSNLTISFSNETGATQVSRLLKEFLSIYRPNDKISFTWTNAQNGGAYVVSKNCIQTISLTSWISEIMELESRYV
jgi:hypothetical protein